MLLLTSMWNWYLMMNGTTSDEVVYLVFHVYCVTSDKDVQLVFDDEWHYF